MTRDITSMLKMAMNRDYFQYEGKFYKPTSGIAMGSPLSTIIAEMFLQDLEQNRLKHLLEGKKFVYCDRHVDDIFIITPKPYLNNLKHNVETYNSQQIKKSITKLLT
jgi:hypothetical protein